MDIKELQIEREYFADMREKIKHNDDLAVFYDHLLEETGATCYEYRSRALRVCCKWFGVDHYRLQQVKDIRQVNLCKDKFCYNCQSVLAARRYIKYSPVLDALYEDYTLCHMVVTIPNVYGDELPPALDKMYMQFLHLIRFLDGRKVIRGIDFTQYGYAGALRALEVTYNREEGTYHPHFHVMLLLRKGVYLRGRNINQYSFDNTRKDDPPRAYSDLEILLQKIWYLLMNGKTVTKEAVQAVTVGYDIHIDRIAKGDYHECFKYACKGAFKHDEETGEADIDNEEVFRILMYSLHRRKMIQGYGILWNFKDEDVALLDEEAKEDYLDLIEELRRFEDPLFRPECIGEIIGDHNSRYISKGQFKRILFEMAREDKPDE